MTAGIAPRVRDALHGEAERLDFVLVPGFKDSGREHWQSVWQSTVPIFQRITQKRWDDPDIHHWISAIRRLLEARARSAILIGHSLGALASACVAAQAHPFVAGVMLVAPAEPSRFEAEDSVPDCALGVPALVVASHTDTLMRFPRAEHWASVWGAELVDLGDAGHINIEAGFGPWPHGLHVLSEFARRVAPHRSVR